MKLTKMKNDFGKSVHHSQITDLNSLIPGIMGNTTWNNTLWGNGMFFYIRYSPGEADSVLYVEGPRGEKIILL